MFYVSERFHFKCFDFEQNSSFICKFLNFKHILIFFQNDRSITFFITGIKIHITCPRIEPAPQLRKSMIQHACYIRENTVDAIYLLLIQIEQFILSILKIVAITYIAWVILTTFEIFVFAGWRIPVVNYIFPNFFWGGALKSFISS